MPNANAEGIMGIHPGATAQRVRRERHSCSYASSYSKGTTRRLATEMIAITLHPLLQPPVCRTHLHAMLIVRVQSNETSLSPVGALEAPMPPSLKCGNIHCTRFVFTSCSSSLHTTSLPSSSDSSPYSARAELPHIDMSRTHPSVLSVSVPDTSLPPSPSRAMRTPTRERPLSTREAKRTCANVRISPSSTSWMSCASRGIEHHPRWMNRNRYQTPR